MVMTMINYISDLEYEQLPIETARQYKYCHCCGMYYNYTRVKECPCKTHIRNKPKKYNFERK